MSRRRTPLPHDWARIRRRILERDNHECQIRGPVCDRRATDVDHVGDRDDHSDANLRAACGPCHDSRTGRQARAVQGTRRRPPVKHPGLLSRMRTRENSGNHQTRSRWQALWVPVLLWAGQGGTPHPPGAR